MIALVIYVPCTYFVFWTINILNLESIHDEPSQAKLGQVVLSRVNCKSGQIKVKSGQGEKVKPSQA